MDHPARPRRKLELTATAVLLVVGLVGVLGVVLGRGPWSGQHEDRPHTGALTVLAPGRTAADKPKADAPFAATDKVDGLRRGQLRTVSVRVTNPDKVAYTILQIRAQPQDADPHCAGAGNLVVSSYDVQRPGARSYVVPRNSSITIPLAVMMLDAASPSDECEAASFRLAVSGTAEPGRGTGTS